LNDTLYRLSRRLGIEMPEKPSGRQRDPGLEPVVETEWFADVLDVIDDTLAQMAMDGLIPAGYQALTVPQLRQEIANRGIDEKATRKDDLIAILEADDAKQETDDDASEDSGEHNGVSDVDVPPVVVPSESDRFSEGEASEEDSGATRDSNDSNGDQSFTEDEQRMLDIMVEEYQEMSYGELQVAVSQRNLDLPEDATPEQLRQMLQENDRENLR
jgi:hypothetical protein